jgi:hypothetical protein
LLYLKEELNDASAEPQPKTMSAYKGVLTAEEANNLQEYVKKSREDWDRNF